MKNKNIWAPWRLKYVEGEREEGCAFCSGLAANEDASKLVLHRGEYCFVMLNRFPYVSGHLMIMPKAHMARIEEVDAPTAAEAWELIVTAKKALEVEMSPDGFNVGLNIGCAGGAGIVDHLHWHVVPRWQGDSNFFPVITGDRVIPQMLEATYELLAPHFAGG